MALSLKRIAWLGLLGAALTAVVTCLIGAYLGVIFSEALARAIVEVLPI